MVLLKPWTAQKIWKLGYPSVPSVPVAHLEPLWRCCLSLPEWLLTTKRCLEQCQWPGHGPGRGARGCHNQQPLGSVAGATCIPANRSVNLNPFPSFLSWWHEDGACVGVQNAGTKLRVRSRNLQMIQGLGVKLCSPPGNVSGKLRIAICVPEQRERYKLCRIKAGFSPECLCNIRRKTNQQTKNLKPQPDFFFLMLSFRNMVIIIIEEQADAQNWLGRVFLLILISVSLFILFILSLLS